MFSVCKGSLVLVCIAVATPSGVFAQSNNVPDLSSSVPNASRVVTPTTGDADESAIAAEERTVKLRDINAEWQRQREALSAEKTRKWREAQGEWKRKLNEINEQDISAAEKTKKRAAISEEKDRELEAYTQTYVEELARINQTREQDRAMIIAAQDEMLVDLAVDEEESGDATVSKGANSGEHFYNRHCYMCHSRAMEDQPAVVSIWNAVNSLSEADFIVRLGIGPGPMQDIPEVQSASDRMLGDVYRYILTWDDEVVAQDDKIPDPMAPNEQDVPPGPTGAAVAGPDLSGTVGVPPSPLPTGLDEPGTRAEVRDQQFGYAQISCNLNGNEFEARWIAPYRSKSGWIPPVQNLSEADDAWVLRLRARLDSPIDGVYPDIPRPGWCTWPNESLGSAAGKSREIVIFARTQSPGFGYFRFTENGVEVHMESDGGGTGDRAKTFAIDVARAVTGTHYSSGRLSRTDGLVHTYVQMIDHRWGPDGEPAFIVVDP